MVASGRTGRPSKLTPAVQGLIVEALERGNYVDTAAEYAGVHRATVFRWLQEGAEPDAPAALRDFHDAVSRARAHAEHRMVEIVNRTAEGGQLLSEIVRTGPDGTEEVEKRYAPPDGRLALEFLGRAHPTRWGRRNALEVSGPDGGPVQIMSSDTLAVHADRIAAHLRELHGPAVIEGETGQ